MAKAIGTIADTAKITQAKGKKITPAKAKGKVETVTDIETGSTALTTGTVSIPENEAKTPETPSIGDNKAPVLEHFHSTAETENEANIQVFQAFQESLNTARKTSALWEGLGVSISSVLAIIIAKTGATPTLRVLETNVRGITKGKVKHVKDDKGNDTFVFEPYVAKVGKPTKQSLEKAKAEKAAYDALPESLKEAQRQVEQTSNILPIGEKNLEGMIRPACELAFLLVFGADANDKIGLTQGTTYCKVRRFLNKPKQPVVPFNKYAGDLPDASMATSDNEGWPKDTYEGAGYNDFTLHPMVPVNVVPVELIGDDGKVVMNETTGKPVYVGKFEYRAKTDYEKLGDTRYVDKEYVGVTVDMVHAHYLRFFGTVDNSGVVTRPTIVPETGLPAIEVPKSRDSNAGAVNSGVATDLSKYSEPTDANIAELQSMLRAEMAKERTVDLKGATNAEKLMAVKVLTLNLPQKKAGIEAMNETEIGLWQDIYLNLKKWAEAHKVEGFIDAEYEADATAQRLMA